MEKKKVIAIVCGGDSSEHEVSLRSAQGIYSFMDKEKFEVFIVVLNGLKWEAELADGKRVPVSREDFSFKVGRRTVKPDFAYITIHGTPGEDGILHLPLPEAWRDYDMLRLTARDARGQEICTWQWPVTTPAKMARRLLAENGTPEMDNETRTRTEAAMAKLAPKIIGQPMPKQTRMDWTLLPDGTVRLNYEYLLDGDYDYAGVAFTYPEQGVTGATLMANGP